jgi:hypothetical protein
MMQLSVLYRRILKVETQDFASHKKVRTIFVDGNVLIEIEFVARETQDFASLQAGAVVMK